MGTVTLAGRALLALVFGVAAVTKLVRPVATRETFRDFGVGTSLARLAGLLPVVELAIAACLGFVRTAQLAAGSAAVLLIVFMAGVANALRLGRRPDCGCFGGFRAAPIGTWTLVRNGLLLMVAGVVAATGPGPAIGRWATSNGTGRTALVAVLVLAAAAVLMRNSRTATVAAAAPPTSNEPSQLTIGELVPDFITQDVNGEPRSLTSLRALGWPVVLVFGSAGCGSCAAILAHLGSWQATLAGRLHIAVIATGNANDARGVEDHYRLSGVLLDRSGEILRAYSVYRTPTAFAIAPDGKLISGPAMGYDAIEDLIRLTLHRGEPMIGQWDQTINAA